MKIPAQGERAGNVGLEAFGIQHSAFSIDRQATFFISLLAWARGESHMAGEKTHSYSVQVRWTGNRGQGTSSYTAYDRAHEIAASGKPVIPGSSDPAFRGDRSRYSPEDLLVAALSTCHMLWYLHLCADAKIVVTDYVDEASGSMLETADGGGRFTEVVLRPTVVIEPGRDIHQAAALHERAHARCFIASSVNFDVRCEPTTRIGSPRSTSGNT